ncbi:hypothetical protein, partial [Bathymodiolus platifrons methanotrophic gill symbiont]|uniref:hypothetical protein n=1 Tax=Bathymodiolus platifrons methanotrophic gill symbiont TaxID=113268 RepID=UPI000B4142DA
MKENIISIEIEGDYLSSFIYSGVLILVDSDFNLTTYSWSEVISQALSGYNSQQQFLLKGYFENSRSSKIPEGFQNNILLVKESALSSCMFIKKNIGVWPSDINVYKNRIYIASEEGVDAIDFSWNSGRIGEFRESMKIWNEATFNIATNNFFRLAIASGQDGVLAFIPKNKMVSDKDISKLVDSVCVDCDWQNDRLIANTNTGVNIIDFSPIPIKKEFQGNDSEYWSIVNTIKKEKPSICELDNINGKHIINSWQAGDKMFLLAEDMSIAIVKQSELKYSSIDNFVSLGSEEVISSRTATFGTVIESQNNLSILGVNGARVIEDDFVTWRVFPRAKNYANHLHIIKDESISILAIAVSPGRDDSLQKAQ